MKEVLLDNVRIGMTTAQPVTTKKGQILAAKGTVLSSNHISRFTFYHIKSIMVIDSDVLEKKEPIEKIEKTDLPVRTERTFGDERVSYAHRLRSTEGFREFQISYALCLEDLKRSFKKIKNKEFKVDKEPILSHSEAISKFRHPVELFNMIQAVRFSEDSIYSHCLNVALEATALGKWLKLPKEDLFNLTTAGLLHGIGKTEIDPEILNKTGKLSPEERKTIETHTLYGYDILKKAGFSEKIYNVSLNHHERLDGSGYPNGLKKGEIDSFSQIIAIIDVYDGMTSIRPYRPPLCAFQVIEEFERRGYGKYNTKYMLTFLQHLAGMNLNSIVMLDNGISGRVVYINRSRASRPIVKLEDGTMIDLSMEKDIHIVSVL